jgi:hypothetical protein
MDLSTRRRAVFTVLSDYVHDDSLWQALAQWESGYSEQSQFELNKFLANCSYIEAIAKNRTAIYRQMIALLMAPENQRLKPDPIRELELYKKQGFTAQKLSRTKNLTLQDIQSKPAFSALTAELLDAVRSDTQQRLKRYLQDQMASLQLEQGVRMGVMHWLDERDKLPDMHIDLLTMRKLVNTLYIGLCESLGPVQADQILNAAAARVTRQHANAGLLL